MCQFRGPLIPNLDPITPAISTQKNSLLKLFSSLAPMSSRSNCASKTDLCTVPSVSLPQQASEIKINMYENYVIVSFSHEVAYIVIEECRLKRFNIEKLSI